MKRLFSATVLTLLLGVGGAAAHQDHGRSGPLCMLGGSCPMMGMGTLGQRETDHGMMVDQDQMNMGQGMMIGQRQMGAMVEGRLAYLKAELAITDDQAVAWQGYAEAVRGRVEAMQQQGHHMFDAMRAGTAIERMEARIDMMETMSDAMKQVLPATKTLYAALDSDQQRIADRLIGMHCGVI